jgi:hypothetical protein
MFCHKTAKALSLKTSFLFFAPPSADRFVKIFAEKAKSRFFMDQNFSDKPKAGRYFASQNF